MGGILGAVAGVAETGEWGVLFYAIPIGSLWGLLLSPLGFVGTRGRRVEIGLVSAFLIAIPGAFLGSGYDFNWPLISPVFAGLPAVIGFYAGLPPLERQGEGRPLNRGLWVLTIGGLLLFLPMSVLDHSLQRPLVSAVGACLGISLLLLLAYRLQLIPIAPVRKATTCLLPFVVTGVLAFPALRYALSNKTGNETFLTSLEGRVRRMAAKSLIQAGQVGPFREALKTRDEVIRNRLVRYVGEMLPRLEAEDVLRISIQDSDWGVRYWSIEALARAGTPRSIPELRIVAEAPSTYGNSAESASEAIRTILSRNSQFAQPSTRGQGPEGVSPKP